MIIVAVKYGKQHKDIKCYQCQKMGLRVSRLPDKEKKYRYEGVHLLIDGLFGGNDHGLLFNIRVEGIPRSWILMEIQININILSKEFLLTNIRDGDKYTNVHGNTGFSQTNLLGDM